MRKPQNLLLLPLKGTVGLLLLTAAFAVAAACSSWKGTAYFNEYFFGVDQDVSFDFLELYSTNNTFPFAWMDWRIEVYPASGAPLTYNHENSSATSCTQSGKTWTTLKRPMVGPYSLPEKDLLIIAKDAAGDIVDTVLYASSKTKALNILSAYGGNLASCPDLQAALSAQVNNAPTTEPYGSTNLFITSNAANKNLNRSPDGGSGLGNVWTASLYTGAGTTYTQCTTNSSTFSKTVSTAYASPGSSITYTLTLENISNRAISDTVTDILPAELSAITSANLSPSAGTSATVSGSPPQTVIWSIPSLARGGTATLAITPSIPNDPALIGRTLVNEAETATAPIQSDLAYTQIISADTPSFLISAPSSASSCGGTIQVTVKAMTLPGGGGVVDTGYTGTVLLSTSIGQGSWSLYSGTGTFVPSGGNATYSFVTGDAGIATFALSGITSDASVLISAIDINTPTITGTSNPVEFTSGASLALSDADWLSPMNVAVAGRPHRIRIQVVPGCVGTTPPIRSPNVAAWYVPSAFAPAAAAAPALAFSASLAGCGGTSATLPAADPGTTNLASLPFANGIAWLYLCTADVGQFALNMRIPRQTTQGVTTELRGSSSQLTVRPFALHLTDLDGNPLTVPDPIAAAPFRKAGIDPADPAYGFGVKATAVLWNAPDDPEPAPATVPATLQGNGLPPTEVATNNIAASIPAPSFGQERPLPATIGLGGEAAAPIGGQPGTVASASTGAYRWNAAWNEVGALSLSATLVGGSYLNSGANVTGRAAPIGRFIPDHFDTFVAGPMACSAAFPAGCPTLNDGATLSDHLAYAVQPFSVTLKARAGGGALTQNYAGSFAKTVALSAWNALGGTVATSTGGFPSGTPIAASAFSAGEATATPVFSFSATPLAPENIYVRAIDTDGASSRRAADPTTTSIEGGIRIVSGRMAIENMYGPPSTRLPVRLRAMYWDGGKWAMNAADTASGASTGNFTLGATSTCTSPGFCGIILVSASGSGTTAGEFRLLLSPPTSGSGRRSVMLNSALPYLTGSGRETFGTFRAPYIYQRER